jgi:UDP-N-acetylmuramate--alanine ligase
MGCTVSGTDIKESAATTFLKEKGATIYIGHKVSNLDCAQVLVVSSAISDDNPEVVVAKRQGMFILRRAEMLSYLMDYCEHRIAIAGTHGKTTTTACVTHLFRAASLVPHVIVGSGMRNGGHNYAVGTSQHFIAEADESDGSFLVLHPNCCVVTNLEEDHMNHFKTRDVLIDSFRKFIQGVVGRKGLAVLNGDDPVLRALASEFDPQYICLTGLSEGFDVRAEAVSFDGKGSHFTIVTKTGETVDISLPLFGTHNIYNALSSFAVAKYYGLASEDLKTGLETFQGTARRLDIVGDVNGIMVFDDYGHHPTEIRAVLATARQTAHRRIVTVFQPHRYTRTKLCWSEFLTCFRDTDELILLPVYAASEDPIPGVDSASLSYAIQQSMGSSIKVGITDTIESAAERVLSILQPGDLVLTLGAGSVTRLSDQLAKLIHERD